MMHACILAYYLELLLDRCASLHPVLEGWSLSAGLRQATQDQGCGGLGLYGDFTVIEYFEGVDSPFSPPDKSTRNRTLSASAPFGPASEDGDYEDAPRKQLRSSKTSLPNRQH